MVGRKDKYIWDSQTFRQHLGAVSLKYDDVLKSKGMDPEKMREHFFRCFGRYNEHLPYGTLVPPDHPVHRTVGAYKDYVIIETNDSDVIYDEGQDLDDHYIEHSGVDINRYFCVSLVENNGVDEFVSHIIEHKKEFPTRYGFAGVEINNEDWTIEDEQKANFIDIAMKYDCLIIDVCKKWGYDRVIKWIKDNN